MFMLRSRLDANGNVAELAQTIRVQDSIVDVCYYPINIASTPFTDLSADLAAGDVEIIYIDGDGVEWKIQLVHKHQNPPC